MSLDPKKSPSRTFCQLFAADGAGRRSCTLKSFTTSNSCESGSLTVKSVTVKVCDPNRGSETFETKLIPNEGANQNSRTLVNGRSLPITQALVVRVILVPTVSTPCILSSPSASLVTDPDPSGSGPTNCSAGL